MKVSCSFCHRGVKLIFAYSCARPAVLAAGKGRGGMLFFSFVLSLFFIFFYFPLSFQSLSFIYSTISSVSFLPFSGGRHKMTHTRVDMSLNANTITKL